MKNHEINSHKINQKNNALLHANDLCAHGLREKQSGNFQEAITLYTQAAAMAPQAPMPHICLGVAFEALGQYGPAADCARRAGYALMLS